MSCLYLCCLVAEAVPYWERPASSLPTLTPPWPWLLWNLHSNSSWCINLYLPPNPCQIQNETFVSGVIPAVMDSASSSQTASLPDPGASRSFTSLGSWLRVSRMRGEAAPSRRLVVNAAQTITHFAPLLFRGSGGGDEAVLEIPLRLCGAPMTFRTFGIEDGTRSTRWT